MLFYSMGYVTALKITYLFCIEAEEWLLWVHWKTEKIPHVFSESHMFPICFFLLLMYPRIVQSTLVILGLNTSHKE